MQILTNIDLGFKLLFRSLERKQSLGSPGPRKLMNSSLIYYFIRMISQKNVNDFLYLIGISFVYEGPNYRATHETKFDYSSIQK